MAIKHITVPPLKSAKIKSCKILYLTYQTEELINSQHLQQWAGFSLQVRGTHSEAGALCPALLLLCCHCKKITSKFYHRLSVLWPKVVVHLNILPWGVSFVSSLQQKVQWPPTVISVKDSRCVGIFIIKLDR